MGFQRHKSVLDDEVNIDGYEIKRSDMDRHCGGVTRYVREDPREDFSLDIENLFFLYPATKIKTSSCWSSL